MDTTILAAPPTCALCDNEVPSDCIRDGDNAFCCPGCHAVYNILAAKGSLDSFHDHPLFQQAVKSGLISNPALLEQVRRRRHADPDEETYKLHLEVGEMWCPSCAEVIKLMLFQEKGIRSCVVDYATDLAAVEYSPREIGKERIFEVIESLGYQARRLEDARKQQVSLSLWLRFGVAAFCAMNTMAFAYPIYASYFSADPSGYETFFARLSFVASLPVIGYSAWPIYRRFWASLQVGLYGMETLVVMGVTTAFATSIVELAKGGTHVYFDSMSVIIAFVLLGKIIETRAKFSAKDALLHLAKSVPRRGKKRFTDGSERYVPVKEFSPGDEIVVATGEKIALDGVVVEGDGACDESVMTGEAVPVAKEIGSSVIGGTILKRGWLVIRITSDAETSALQQIIDMVELDIGHKSQYVRAVDVVVRAFVPVVLLLAGATGLYHWLATGVPADAVIRGVSVLLISCPCAIGIAAPLAESHLINGLAKLGAIVRNRGCLPLLGKETVMVFDKTGTITEGIFTVHQGLDVLSLSQSSALKALAAQSTHPIAGAVADAIDAPSSAVTKVTEVAGKGIIGFVGGCRYALGSSQLMADLGVASPLSERAGDGIISTVYVAEGDRLLTTLQLCDAIKRDAKEVLTALSPAQTLLLSGDGEAAVTAVARACGFDNYRYGCSPLDKRDVIEQLRKDRAVICMVGDGINDAPSLTGADIGISVVTATDMSIQVSDILLTTDTLRVLPKIRHLARKGQRIIHQNLFWAFIYNVIGITLAIAGCLTPLFAAVAMIASSLIVLFNAQRISR